jgi:hypothetical protein
MSTFAIVDMRDGIRRDVKSFLLDNDSFPNLEDCFLFRGRIQRKSCYTPIGIDEGRLRWIIGTTGGSPFTYTLLNIPVTSGYSQFTIGSVIFTDPGGASPVNLLSSNALYSGTLNRTTGALSITHPVIAATSVYYYPGLSVMGLSTREQSSFNDELLVGFDTRYSYLFDTASQNFVAANTYKTTNSIFTWTGADSDFFWTVNYFNALFTTNNISGLNAFTITGGTDATPSVITIGTGHNVLANDIVMILNTDTGNTLNGRTFQVTSVAATTITINNTVAPGGGAYASGFVVLLNRKAVSTGTSTVTAGDAIKWYDGPGSGTGWVNFLPPLNAATPQRVLRGSLMLLAYKDRLLALNTYESSGNAAAINYQNRARFCQVGTPFFTEDNAATPVEYLLPANQSANYDAWFDATPGKGGFIDAPTNEAIVSAEFVKDTLIVYFERSTWQLVYTGNDVLPFVFQKINTELGCESTFSQVPFDKGVFGVGNYGIITTDSVNVVRIDQKIPDEVFQINNSNNGVKRVHGIRDYTAQLVYWTIPTPSDEDGEVSAYSLTYPNQVLVYNYIDGSWSEFVDSFTCFGYWQTTSDVTWAELERTWESTAFSWDSQYFQAKYPNVVAGNQRGFVFVINQVQINGQNSPCLEISDFSAQTISCPNHNLTNNQYVLIDDCTGYTVVNGEIFRIGNASVNSFDLIPAAGSSFSATGYTGGGTITVIPNINITTKEFNPFYQQGKASNVQALELFMDRSENGEMTVDYFIDDNNAAAVTFDVSLSSPEPSTSFSQNQQKIWHKIYPNVYGAFFQLEFFLSDEQMRDLSIASSNIAIHGLIFYVSPSGRLSYDF